MNPAQPTAVPPAAPAQGRTSLSVKIPPRASEIFHAFQVAAAAAVFVRVLLKTSDLRLKRSACVQSLAARRRRHRPFSRRPPRPLIWAVPVRLMSCLAACARCHLFFQAANGVLALGDRRGSSFNGALESGGEVLKDEFYPLWEGVDLPLGEKFTP